MNSNIYYHPEAYGLTVVAEADVPLEYEYDTWVCWVDRSGLYWWANDSGCSCPVPFEEMNLSNLPSGSLRDAITDLKAWMHGEGAWQTGQRAGPGKSAVAKLEALL